MRVAICSDGVFPLAVGGIQRHTRLLVETLARRHPDLEIVVVHPHEGRRVFADSPNVREISVAPRPGKSQYMLECYGLAARMRKVVAGMPDAIVYAQGSAGWMRSRALRRRLIVNPHGLEAFQSAGLRGATWKDRVAGFLMRAASRDCFRRARYVVSLGGTLTRILRSAVSDPDRRVVVIPNGVTMPAADVVRPADPVRPLRALFVGRFAANKGIPDLLAAVDLLAERGLSDRVHVDLVGGGPLFDPLSGANRRPNVVFHGAVDDAALERLYREAHVFVLPTLFEGMPTVVLEAMARRLPILVTDVGATREMVDDSNGAIIGKQAPAELADRLVEMAGLSPERRIAMGDASRRRVEDRFTWDAVADAHHALFASLRAELDGGAG